MSRGCGERLQGGARLLIVGAGGIGSEVLNSLKHSFSGPVDIVDSDVIELSNLNRQLFFDREDIGRPKAICAAERVTRLTGGRVEACAYFRSITEKCFNLQFFRRYTCVLSCVDNVEARRHLNLMGLFAGIPVIESGSAGYLGQVSVNIPGRTECYECNGAAQENAAALDAEAIPVCTIRSRPSKWRHCVQWATEYLIPRLREPSTALNWSGSEEVRSELAEILPWIRKSIEGMQKEVPDDSSGGGPYLHLVHTISGIRARTFGISQEKEEETRSIIDRTIPAICTTNAIIGGLMAIELGKLLSGGPSPQTYFLTAQPSLVRRVAPAPPSPACQVCSHARLVLHIDPTCTLRALLQLLLNKLGPSSSGEPFPRILIMLPGEESRGELVYDAEFDSNLGSFLEDLGVGDGSVLHVAREAEGNPSCLVYLNSNAAVERPLRCDL